MIRNLAARWRNRRTLDDALAEALYRGIRGDMAEEDARNRLAAANVAASLHRPQSPDFEIPPATQMAWMLAYIARRYGTGTAA